MSVGVGALGGIVHGGIPPPRADAGPARGDEALHLFDDARPRTRTGGHEARHQVALLAPQELIHRHSQAARHQVVQGDVDRRQRRRQYAAALEILTAVEELPQAADAARILADEEAAEVVDRAPHRQLAARQAGLAVAVGAVVTLDLEDEQVAPSRPYRKTLDRRDLHGAVQHTPGGGRDAPPNGCCAALRIQSGSSNPKKLIRMWLRLDSSTR